MPVLLPGNIIFDGDSLFNFLSGKTDTQEIDIFRGLAAFIIIFILQTQQKLIDQPDLITVSLVQNPHPALFHHLPGF